MINFKEKDNIILAYKPIGKTPLEIINELKQNYGYSKTKMSYAGRLDPMAHGLMIILKDAECYKQHLYHNFSKIYKFKLLLGISTDTFDILGKITNNSNSNININTDNLYSIINSLIGKQKQHYPPYSSARVDGHPLWYYAKNNLLHTITIPYKEIEPYFEYPQNDLLELHKDILKLLNVLYKEYLQKEKKTIENNKSGGLYVENFI